MHGFPHAIGAVSRASQTAEIERKVSPNGFPLLCIPSYPRGAIRAVSGIVRCIQAQSSNGVRAFPIYGLLSLGDYRINLFFILSLLCCMVYMLSFYYTGKLCQLVVK
jgi:hypothetical protein